MLDCTFKAFVYTKLFTCNSEKATSPSDDDISANNYCSFQLLLLLLSSLLCQGEEFASRPANDGSVVEAQGIFGHLMFYLFALE